MSKHLFVSKLHGGAPLLVVAGRPLHALPLRGDAVVVVPEVLVQTLHDLQQGVSDCQDVRLGLNAF